MASDKKRSHTPGPFQEILDLDYGPYTGEELISKMRHLRVLEQTLDDAVALAKEMRIPRSHVLGNAVRHLNSRLKFRITKKEMRTYSVGLVRRSSEPVEVSLNEGDLDLMETGITAGEIDTAVYIGLAVEKYKELRATCASTKKLKATAKKKS